MVQGAKVPTEREVWFWDDEAHNAFVKSRPWKDDPRHFQHCWVTPVATLGILRHALWGCEGDVPSEIMGFCTGRPIEGAFIVNGFIPFPVRGGETSVQATSEMITMTFAVTDAERALGHPTACSGWYHSHPDLGCFFSETDVRGHRQQQMLNGAFCGLVVDPIATTTSGTIHLGCYVTLPAGPDDDKPPPANMVERWGSAANKYYSLPIHCFLTPTDKMILAEIVSRSYGQQIAASQLRLNARYVASQTLEVARTMEQHRMDPGQGAKGEEEMVDVRKKLGHVHEDRKTGIWLEQLKRRAFGL